MLMQLIEYFIWKNINNLYYNRIFSLYAEILLIVQPIASLMLLNSVNLKWNMILVYSSLAFPYSIWKLTKAWPYSSITPNGHLKWNFLQNDKKTYIVSCIIWVFFLLFSIFYNATWYEYTGVVFGLATLIISIYNFYKDESIFSMWCWSINTIMIYYAGYLLLYLPFCEKNRIC